ncbi:MAG: TIGR02099 family protein [Agarilytica sp.]
MKLTRKHWYSLSRRFWGTLFTLVIALAVLVQLGRQAFPLLNDYREEIAVYFGHKLNANLEVAELNASWKGLRPKLSMNDVLLSTKEGERIFSVDNVTMELSIIRSVLDLRFSWREVNFLSMDLALNQAENGKWSVKGMAGFAKASQNKNNSKSPVINNPYDVFLFGRRIKIENANFALQFFDGESSKIVIPEISIENDRSFHRIRAGLDFDDQQALSFVVEAHGDPREKGFVANGYFELVDFPSHRVIDVLALDDVIDVDEQHAVNVKLWFRSDKESGTTLRGDFSVDGLLSVKGKEFNLPSYVASQISGKVHKEKGWQLTLKSLETRWKEDVAAPITDFTLYGSGRNFQGVRTGDLEAKPWVDVALHVGINDEFAEEILRGLSPRGTVKDVDIQLTDKASGYFNARARVVGGQVNAVMGSPAIENIHANVSVNLFGGRADVSVKDGFTLGLPKVYHEALVFDEVEGQISWELDFKERIAYITSGLVKVKNPDEEASGYISLTLPFAKKYGTQHMTLALGLKNTLARNHKKYVPKTIPKHLYDWLDTSIKEGRLANIEFLYHGSIEGDPVVDPSIQLYGEVYDGNLVFDPQWPKLEGVSGSLRLNNEALDVRIDEASLLGNSVYDAAIHLVDDPTSDGRALSIEGSLLSDASAAITLLKSSPIKEIIGSTFDAWEFSGGVTAKVALFIPLESESSGLSHKIDVSFDKAEVNMPDIGLALNDIGGILHYQSEKGMYAEKIGGSVWGRPFEAAISTVNNDAGGQDTLIDFSGRASVSDLYSWTQQPALRFSEGESTVLGQLKIPSSESGKPFEINVKSQLVGVSLNLPEPLGKEKSKPVGFSSRLRFFDDGEEYQFTIDDQFRLSLLTSEDESTSAKIEFNNFSPDEKTDARIAATKDYRISGRISHADLEKWDEIKDQYFKYEEEISLGSDEVDDTPVFFEVDIDKFLLGTFEIENITIEGQRDVPFWVLNVDSKLMAGKVKVPEDDRPITLDLSYLRFEDEESEKEGGVESVDGADLVDESVLADIDLARAVDIDFSADEFSLGAVNYGAWDFKLRRIEDGVFVHDIKAKLKGMEVGGGSDKDGEKNKGAEFTWLQKESGQSSKFSGQIKADDLADVFEAWGQEKLIESKSAKIDIDALWPGAPDEVTVKTVQGLVKLDIRKGSFERGAGSDESALLRLLALFNFDTILRRLRLDFSDLASQGFSFDRVYGDLDFNNGKIYFSEPLIVESSSSTVQLVGTIDAIKEKLDTEMIVTLPLASSAAFATALVVNLPAAVGLYVMSKLFKKQLDKASSLKVEVRGRWEDPKVKVRKIFNVKDMEKRGEEVKKQQEQDILQTENGEY